MRYHKYIPYKGIKYTGCTTLYFLTYSPRIVLWEFEIAFLAVGSEDFDFFASRTRGLLVAGSKGLRVVGTGDRGGGALCSI